MMSDVVVLGSLWMASAIRTEASLSFIGLGVQPPTPTWGGMIREGFENILTAWWLAVFPSLAILLTVLALNILGAALRDAIDPKLRSENAASARPCSASTGWRPSSASAGRGNMRGESGREAGRG